ncbi:MAG: hypothetical protein WC556_02755 [Candidatus Methanoperedens sp.]
MTKKKNALAVVLGVIVLVISSFLGGLSTEYHNPFFFLVTFLIVIGGSITAMGIYGLIKGD